MTEFVEATGKSLEFIELVNEDNLEVLTAFWNENKAEINKDARIGKNEWAVFHIAVGHYCESEEVVDFLIDTVNCDVKAITSAFWERTTPLILAAYNNNSYALKKIIQKLQEIYKGNSDGYMKALNYKDKKGSTALSDAERQGHTECIEILNQALEQGLEYEPFPSNASKILQLPTKKIAIIGGGKDGTNTAIQLLRTIAERAVDIHFPIEILLIDQDKNNFGQGNVTTFQQALGINAPKLNYIKDLNEAIQSTGLVKVTPIEKLVLDILPDEHKIICADKETLENRRVIESDVIILATGQRSITEMDPNTQNPILAPLWKNLVVERGICAVHETGKGINTLSYGEIVGKKEGFLSEDFFATGSLTRNSVNSSGFAAAVLELQNG